MTEIILIRHGETEWNVIGRYQGQADPSLNTRGIEQAEILAEKLSDENLDFIISSPLTRAAQTAKILANKLGLPVKYDERLMEIHLGEWESQLKTDIEVNYPEIFKIWQSTPWEISPPGGEYLIQVQQRVNEAVDEIACRYPSDRIGLVTHRIPIALIKIRFQKLGPDIVRTIRLPNTYHEALHIECLKEV